MAVAAIRDAAFAERQEARERWCSIWGCGLSLSDMLAMYRALESHPFESICLHRTFILPSPVSDQHPFVASCEVFITPATTWTLQSQQFSQVTVWHIACLFVPLEHRGKRYATVLVNEVGRVAEENGAVAVILYSDIGSEVYERLGFQSLCDSSLLLDMTLSPSLFLQQCPAYEFNVVDIKDCKTISSAMLLRNCPMEEGSIMLQLDFQRLDWYLCAERYCVDAGLMPEIVSYGCQLYESDGLVGQVVWSHDIEKKELVILSLTTNDSRKALVMLRRACEVALLAGFVSVRIWDDCHRDVPLLPGATLEARQGKLPMMRSLSLVANPKKWCGPQRGLWY